MDSFQLRVVNLVVLVQEGNRPVLPVVAVDVFLLHVYIQTGCHVILLGQRTWLCEGGSFSNFFGIGSGLGNVTWSFQQLQLIERKLERSTRRWLHERH